MILLLLCLGVSFIIWLLQRQWKMRKILAFSREIGNVYTAFPIIGHAIRFLGSGEDRMKTFQSLGRSAIKSKHGMTSIWIGSMFVALICDPIVAETIGKTCLEKSELMHLAWPLVGRGSIFALVPIWRPRRKILAPAFSVKNLNSFVETFAEQSLLMVDNLKPTAGAGTFSIWKYVTLYTMDSVCESILGVNINAQGLPNHPVLIAFNEYIKIMSARFCQPWMQWEVYKSLPRYAKEVEYIKTIHDFVDEIVKEKRLEIEQEKDNDDALSSSLQNKKKPTLLDLLILASGGKNGYTNLELREEALVLLLAGTDTSAVAASFVAVLMSRHPDIQDKVYEEIREIFGDSRRPITPDDLTRLKYTEAVIKETMRLYPPVPIIARKNERDIKLPSGVTVRAGTSSALHIWGIQRHPRYWGPDAEEFNPERFLKGPLEYPSAYMCFSYGPRNCLGGQYAIMSIKVAVATLIREYRVLPPSDIPPEDLKKPLRVSFDVMLKNVDDYKLRLESRT